MRLNLCPQLYIIVNPDDDLDEDLIVTSLDNFPTDIERPFTNEYFSKYNRNNIVNTTDVAEVILLGITITTKIRTQCLKTKTLFHG